MTPPPSKSPRISLVVAMAENRVIGREGGLPWKISADLKYFKQITMGKPVLMGRKTYVSIGRPLPGRTNIVISRNAGFSADGVLLAPNLDAAIALGQSTGADEIMIIGGAEIYRLALPRADRIYMTEIHAVIDGDAHFPEFGKNNWQEAARQDLASDPAFSFVVLDRIDL